MNARFLYKVYPIPMTEDMPAAIEVPLVARSDGALVVGDQEELDIDGIHRYRIFLIFSKSNKSLSLEISNESGILIRFGGVVSSSIGLGVSMSSFGKHVEIIFDPG